MKVYEVVGVTSEWDENDARYALCATRKLAERELRRAQREDPNLKWSIEERRVVDK